MKQDVLSRLEILLSHRIPEEKSRGASATLTSLEKLTQELNPGSLLSYQTASKHNSLPLQKREILASAEHVKEDMNNLSQIRGLLGDKIANSPVISSERYDIARDPKRLDEVLKRMDDVLRRVDAVAVAEKVYGLICGYRKIILAADEKLVLAEEDICSLRRKEQMP